MKADADDEKDEERRGRGGKELFRNGRHQSGMGELHNGCVTIEIEIFTTVDTGVNGKDE